MNVDLEQTFRNFICTGYTDGLCQEICLKNIVYPFSFLRGETKYSQCVSIQSVFVELPR